MGNERLNGELISEWLEKKRESYEALAALVGVSSSTIRAMEKGYVPRRGRQAILNQLAKTIGTSVAALVIQVSKAG